MRHGTRKGIFALAVAAALGFGAAQAFASPGAEAARACSQPQCDQYCKSRGATGGQCVMGGCMCYVELPPAS